MKYYLVAGEASGDLHASNLMLSLRELDREADFRFFGGDLMAAAGGRLVKHYRELAFMGIGPVILNSRTILRNLALCKKDIANYQPDVVILVDYPGFNLKIAKYVKRKLNIPVHYYISPKVWAWKEYRIKQFRKYLNLMLSILPFEVDFYKNKNFIVNYVGNPVVDAVASRDYQNESFEQFVEANSLSPKPVIALVPGSRRQEIAANLPVILESVKSFAEGYQFVITGAPGVDPEFYRGLIGEDSNLSLLFNQTYRILAQSEAALVTSGTASLEAALLNVPQLVCYHTPLPRLSKWAFDHILHTPYISLVNLICGNQVVNEFFAVSFKAENIRRELTQLLHVQRYRATMLDNYREMQQILGGPGASERAANVIYSRIV